MEKRYKVPKSELNELYSLLKSKDYTIREINEIIDAEFRNYLYKGSSIPPETFRKLEELAKREIQHKEILYVDGRGEVTKKNHSRCRNLAELVGIILGDGHIHSSNDKNHSGNYISVTLNENEERLFQKTVTLFEEFFDAAYTYNSKNARSIQVRSFGAENVEFLIRNGLESGNKVENQVKAPEWIFEEQRMVISALRGLVDTDGSIYRRKHDGYVVIQFRNRSYRLLEDFEKMCNKIGVKCSSGGKYDVQIASQDEVIKFLELVEPIKENRIERPIKA